MASANPFSSGPALNSYNFGAVTRARKTEFYAAQQRIKHPMYGAEFRNPYIPHGAVPRNGFKIPKAMSGVGKVYADPLDAFKPEKLDVQPKQVGVRPKVRFTESRRMRNKARWLYDKANPNNARMRRFD
jgi:hypothetical protein